MKILLVGGPYDGAELSTGLGTVFLFTDGKRCFRAPRRGRVLYRAMADLHSATSSYRYVEHLMMMCKCGGFRKRSKPCGLCGAKEVAG